MSPNSFNALKKLASIVPASSAVERERLKNIKKRARQAQLRTKKAQQRRNAVLKPFLKRNPAATLLEQEVYYEEEIAALARYTPGIHHARIVAALYKAARDALGRPRNRIMTVVKHAERTIKEQGIELYPDKGTRTPLTATELRTVMNYNEETGEFIWMQNTTTKRQRSFVGETAGYITPFNPYAGDQPPSEPPRARVDSVGISVRSKPVSGYGRYEPSYAGFVPSSEKAYLEYRAWVSRYIHDAVTSGRLKLRTASVVSLTTVPEGQNPAAISLDRRIQELIEKTIETPNKYIKQAAYLDPQTPMPVYKRYYWTKNTDKTSLEALMKVYYYIAVQRPRRIITIRGKQYAADALAYMYKNEGGDWDYADGLDAIKKAPEHDEVEPWALRSFDMRTNRPIRIVHRDGVMMNDAWENIKPDEDLTRNPLTIVRIPPITKNTDRTMPTYAVEQGQMQVRKQQASKRIVKMHNCITKCYESQAPLTPRWRVKIIGRQWLLYSEEEAIEVFNREIVRCRGIVKKIAGQNTWSIEAG
jgi:hypothetical protein